MSEKVMNPIYSLYPPSPPTDEKEVTIQNPGLFEYVSNIHSRELYINAYQAITLTEMWAFMKEEPGNDGYMFSGNPNLQIISAKMNELFGGYIKNPHSGCSFACTMRAMQYIAKNGELAFKNSKMY